MSTETTLPITGSTPAATNVAVSPAPAAAPAPAVTTAVPAQPTRKQGKQRKSKAVPAVNTPVANS